MFLAAGAYFVTYQSHILLEQGVVLVACMSGLPRDVFNFYMYYGVLGTFIEHCGYEVRIAIALVPPATYLPRSRAPAHLLCSRQLRRQLPKCAVFPSFVVVFSLHVWRRQRPAQPAAWPPCLTAAWPPSPKAAWPLLLEN